MSYSHVPYQTTQHIFVFNELKNCSEDRANSDRNQTILFPSLIFETPDLCRSLFGLSEQRICWHSYMFSSISLFIISPSRCYMTCEIISICDSNASFYLFLVKLCHEPRQLALLPRCLFSSHSSRVLRHMAKPKHEKQ